MKNLFLRFASGINLASQNFKILALRPYLILYLLIPAIVAVFSECVVYNLSFGRLCLETYNTTTISYVLYTVLLGTLGANTLGKGLLLILVLLIHIAIITYVTLFLIEHAVQKKFFSALLRGIKKIPQATLWVLMSLFPILFFDYMKANAFTAQALGIRILLFVNVVLFALVWSFFSLFILIVIAQESLSLWHSIKKSITISRLFFIEYVGGLFWLELVMLLFLNAIFLVQKICIKFTPEALVTIVISVLILLISCTVSTVHMLFKINLYQLFQQKQALKTGVE